MNLFNKRFCNLYLANSYKIIFLQEPYWMALAYQKVFQRHMELECPKFLGY